ncbi:hypothetical protein RBA41_25065 [Massilia sp. CCM 9210]|uniref:hypothetical protein n=1 Tax=Massilia scottii TaxID=3057166 RepID=UPI0027969B91|nr:hypothetical protein [Massilia sp. CCM 9210]MDQ1816575.1 hypothetical protein [Massilia sp. CCM 9210]
MTSTKRKLVKLDGQTGDYAEVDKIRLKREARELIEYIKKNIDPNKDEYGIWTSVVPLCQDVLAEKIPLPVSFFSLPLRYESREQLLETGFDELFSEFKLTISGAAREILDEVVIDGVRYMYADFEE